MKEDSRADELAGGKGVSVGVARVPTGRPRLCVPLGEDCRREKSPKQVSLERKGD